MLWGQSGPLHDEPVLSGVARRDAAREDEGAAQGREGAVHAGRL